MSCVLAGKCPASPALWAESRGTIKMIFPFREAPACGRGASISMLLYDARTQDCG
jgi:hypothetical protein